MEDVQDVVIAGAGIAGLATALGLHRLGIRSLVLESADSLRTTGYAFGMWTNAWRAVDALGIGYVLRSKYKHLTGIVTTSVDSGIITSEMRYTEDIHVRCINRRVLLETLENELPTGTIRFSSKVVCIESAGYFKSVHLADGTILKTKVLIGCDGVNSVVAKFLGFNKVPFAGRSAIRGMVQYKDGHGFEPKFMQFLGKGIRYGVIPSDDHSVYWFFNFSPSTQDKEMEEDPVKTRQFILGKLGKVSDKIRGVFEDTELSNMVCAPLRFRYPWDLIWGNISKDNICVAGDALHPMTPDIAQGACAALEDAIVLARVLGEALKGKLSSDEQKENGEEHEYHVICKGLEKFARERRWRSIDLISTAYMVGFMQQKNGIVVNFLRDKMAKFLAGILLKKASFDCGKLTVY